MCLAFVLAMILVLSGGWLIHEDKDPQGMSVIATTLATFCGAFVYATPGGAGRYGESTGGRDCRGTRFPPVPRRRTGVPVVDGGVSE
jgi:hypothetical protein